MLKNKINLEKNINNFKIKTKLIRYLTFKIGSQPIYLYFIKQSNLILLN